MSLEVYTREFKAIPKLADRQAYNDRVFVTIKDGIQENARKAFGFVLSDAEKAKRRQERERQERECQERERQERERQEREQIEKDISYMTTIRACKILGVSILCDMSDLKRAYKKGCLRFHPDKGGTHEEFIRVQKAYEILENYNGFKTFG